MSDNTPPQKKDDDVCACGYKRAIHPTPTCRSFERSAFLSDMQLPDNWAEDQKRLKRSRR